MTTKRMEELKREIKDWTRLIEDYQWNVPPDKADDIFGKVMRNMGTPSSNARMLVHFLDHAFQYNDLAWIQNPSNRKERAIVGG